VKFFALATSSRSSCPPTSTMIGVTRLSHPDFLIEIDLVAITEA
jgi:enamine deaminase RidA (YjgF/YER057c/UK114 family)